MNKHQGMFLEPFVSQLLFAKFYSETAHRQMFILYPSQMPPMPQSFPLVMQASFGAANVFFHSASIYLDFFFLPPEFDKQHEEVESI